eukprot:TRINITY_DN3677_c0_g1_i1.p1 TRINITY_DN3677_c0_g1~~TRINITY_DN3677_c0_g1_i1.p1  ORF type:complete len:427 (+),score=45.48 TRINITY_DN3677_c0_g1_i1:74-1282(+)
MVLLFVCALSVASVQGLASALPLKSRWSASISGVNHDQNVSGKFQWDTGLEAVHLEVAASWTFKSFFEQQGLDDSMSFTCSLPDLNNWYTPDSCTSTLRKNCWHGLTQTRTTSLVWLLVELYANGTHQGTCFSDRNIAGSQKWTVKLEGVGNLAMCITPDGLPLTLTSEPDPNFTGESNVIGATYNFSFHDVSLHPQAMVAPTCPKCAAAAPCPGRGVETMKVMRLTDGDGEPFDQIWNLDTADMSGEIMFDHTFGRTYLKVFNVTLNSSFGPYRDCNYVNGQNTCALPEEPSLAKLVTRMVAEDFGDGGCHEGQCSRDKEVGSWYTFPKEGGCVKGAAIGTDGCTWQVNSIKVVSTECLKSSNVRAAYAQDMKRGHLPFLNLEALVWERIAACPDIRSLRR